MAARVTKLFLQNCLAARAPAAGKKGKATGVAAKTAKTAPAAKSSSRRRKAKANGNSTSTKIKAGGVRFLEAAQHEQKQADKTKENLRKLKTRANDKSKRLMAKALEKRQALRLV